MTNNSWSFNHAFDNQFSSFGRIHHVGLATRDMSSSRLLLTALGFVEEGSPIVDKGIGVVVQFLVSHEFRIELVSPLDEESPVLPWLSQGSPLYHFAIELNHDSEFEAALKSNGFRKVFGPHPAIAFEGRNVCFYMNKDRLLIETIAQAEI